MSSLTSGCTWSALSYVTYSLIRIACQIKQCFVEVATALLCPASLYYIGQSGKMYPKIWIRDLAVAAPRLM